MKIGIILYQSQKMKLRLKNFRCYEDQTFDLGEKGLTLLSAATGTGKSSILMGVYFALFGVGSKVVSHGKTSCLVELEFGDIKISRTKRPNRLVVNGQYEDKAGQDIINQTFGETYETTGYISQNALNSFVLLSPLDKLGFLEKFAFKDVELAKLKAKSKSLISERHDILVGVSAKLDMANSMLDSELKPDNVPFPIKCKKSDIEKVAKGEEIKCKNREISARKASKQIQGLQEELQALTQFSADTSKNETILESLNERLKELTQSIENCDSYDENELKEMKSNLSGLLSSRKVAALRKRLDDDNTRLLSMEEEERNGLIKEIETLEKDMWVEYGSQEEYEEVLQSTLQSFEDIKKIEELQKFRSWTDHVNVEIETKREECNEAVKDLSVKSIAHSSGKIYQCPCCQEDLFMKDGTLQEYKGVIGEECTDKELLDAQNRVKNLRIEIEDLAAQFDTRVDLTNKIDKIMENYEEPLPSLAELSDDISTLREYSDSVKMNEKRLKTAQKELSDKKYSRSFTSFQKSCKDLEQELLEEEKISGDLNYDHLDEETLRKSIVKAEGVMKSLIAYRREKKSVNETIEKTMQTIETKKEEYMSMYLFRSPEDIKKEISALKIEQDRYEVEHKKHAENVDAIKEWKAVENEIAEYNLKKDRARQLVKDEKDARLSYASATLLKSKIAEAESLAMVSIIESINIHSQLYLDTFFPEHPMTVKLTPFKQGKKTAKPQINLEVEHKGMECDITSLSGGELSRVVLAFTLALAEMFNTPLLLLDECTSSLDQEMTGTVLSGIKENFSGSMVLIVAHQVVTGVFDKVMTLDQEDEQD